MSSDSDTPSLPSTEAHENGSTSDQSSSDSTEQIATESVTSNETPTIVPTGPQVGCLSRDDSTYILSIEARIVIPTIDEYTTDSTWRNTKHPTHW
jgi:hypothetical protein